MLLLPLLFALLLISTCLPLSTIDCAFDDAASAFCGWRPDRGGVWRTGNAVLVDAVHSLVHAPESSAKSSSGQSDNRFAFVQGQFGHPTEGSLRSPLVVTSGAAELRLAYWKASAVPQMDICVEMEDEADHGHRSLRCVDTIQGPGQPRWVRRAVELPDTKHRPFRLVLRARNLLAAEDVIGLDDIQLIRPHHHYQDAVHPSATKMLSSNTLIGVDEHDNGIPRNPFVGVEEDRQEEAEEDEEKYQAVYKYKQDKEDKQPPIVRPEAPRRRAPFEHTGTTTKLFAEQSIVDGDGDNEVSVAAQPPTRYSHDEPALPPPSPPSSSISPAEQMRPIPELHTPSEVQQPPVAPLQMPADLFPLPPPLYFPASSTPFNPLQPMFEGFAPIVPLLGDPPRLTALMDEPLHHVQIIRNNVLSDDDDGEDLLVGEEDDGATVVPRLLPNLGGGQKQGLLVFGANDRSDQSDQELVDHRRVRKQRRHSTDQRGR